MNRAEIKADQARKDEHIEQLTNAVAGEKAETATVVRDLDVKLRYRRWLHNTICESPLVAPFLSQKQRDND